MTDIYDTFNKATSSIGAYALLSQGEAVGRVIFKRGTSGNVRCFLQLWGFEMQQGSAGGFGYDKESAAFAEAACKLKRRLHDELASVKQTIAKEYSLSADNVELAERVERERVHKAIESFLTPVAIDACDSAGWRRACEDCGINTAIVI